MGIYGLVVGAEAKIEDIGSSLNVLREPQKVTVPEQFKAVLNAEDALQSLRHQSLTLN